MATIEDTPSIELNAGWIQWVKQRFVSTSGRWLAPVEVEAEDAPFENPFAELKGSRRAVH
jgi:hypothetical protein